MQVDGELAFAIYYKNKRTFHFNRNCYNPDLCILSKDKNGVTLHARRTVLSNFSKSQPPSPTLENQTGSPLLNKTITSDE